MLFIAYNRHLVGDYMKLNNHGWGLNEMLILVAVLLSFLLIAVFFIIQLSKDLGDTIQSINGKVTYNDVESNIKNAAITYFEKYYDAQISNGTITITTNNLLKYKILNNKKLIPTEEDNECKGYVLVYKDNLDTKFDSYIKCEHYETVGYQAWRLGE